MALDLGSGAGGFTRRLQGMTGMDFVGVDYVVEAAQMAASFSRAGIIGYLAADSLALPFREKTFDLVSDRGCLHHIEGRKRRERYLREVHRVLRPGGNLLLVGMGERTPRRWWDRIASALFVNVSPFGSLEIERLSQGRFEHLGRKDHLAWMPLSHRFFPLRIPVNFQVHRLSARSAIGRGGGSC